MTKIRNIEEQLLYYNWLIDISFVVGIVTFSTLWFVKAPYGRHVQKGWGPTFRNKYCWMIMECPSLIVFGILSWKGRNTKQLVPMILTALWLWHYFYRTFIYPNIMNSKNKNMPLLIAFAATLFNIFNSYLNGQWIGEFGTYDDYSVTDPQFICGVVLFLSGHVLNVYSDLILILLRKPGETVYKIPWDGAFCLVSCPNYLGEIIEWTGWAIATWSRSGLFFALFTCANLIPRAYHHHEWYKSKFGEKYPKERFAIIPYIL